jgi:hypothetical protein
MHPLPVHGITQIQILITGLDSHNTGPFLCSFGASNIGKLLSKVPAADRNNTINSLAYEAHARLVSPPPIGAKHQPPYTFKAE